MTAFEFEKKIMSMARDKNVELRQIQSLITYFFRCLRLPILDPLMRLLYERR